LLHVGGIRRNGGVSPNFRKRKERRTLLNVGKGGLFKGVRI